MNVEFARSFLLWCSVINYGILLLWILGTLLFHDPIARLQGRLFRLSTERFDTLNYAGLSFFKLAIILFNLVPFVVLTILR